MFSDGFGLWIWRIPWVNQELQIVYQNLSAINIKMEPPSGSYYSTISSHISNGTMTKLEGSENERQNFKQNSNTNTD